MVEIRSREGTGVEISARTAELSGLFRAMLEEDGEPEPIPMPWSFEDVKRVTDIMTRLADEGGQWDAKTPNIHLSALATKFMLPDTTTITTQLAQAHNILQLMDFADVRPAVTMLHAFILHTLSFATTPDDVLKMWLGPLTYAALDPLHQQRIYETCLSHFQF